MTGHAIGQRLIKGILSWLLERRVVVERVRLVCVDVEHRFTSFPWSRFLDLLTLSGVCALFMGSALSQGLVTRRCLTMIPKNPINPTDSPQMKKRIRSLQNRKYCEHTNTVTGANAGIQRVVCEECGHISFSHLDQAVI